MILSFQHEENFYENSRVYYVYVMMVFLFSFLTYFNFIIFDHSSEDDEYE